MHAKRKKKKKMMMMMMMMVKKKKKKKKKKLKTRTNPRINGNRYLKLSSSRTTTRRKKMTIKFQTLKTTMINTIYTETLLYIYIYINE